MVRTAVIGVGILGIKVAGYLAYRGHEVRIHDSNIQTLNNVNKRISEEARIYKEDGIMTNCRFLGDIFCFSKLEDAVRGALFIFECIPDDLTIKQDLFKLIEQYCSEHTIITTSTMSLSVERVFEHCNCKDRCLGVRFLYPVYYVPEVEIMPITSYTSVETLDRVRQFLEKMGQIAFFRSGNEPIVLNEQQRSSRRDACIKALIDSKTINNRFVNNIPNLGRIQYQQQSNQSGTQQSNPQSNSNDYNLTIDHGNNTANDSTSNDDKQSLIIRNNECVICMDNQRDCVLHPCHHLCVCIKCGRLLMKRNDSCPICRRSINNAIRIFRS